MYRMLLRSHSMNDHSKQSALRLRVLPRHSTSAVPRSVLARMQVMHPVVGVMDRATDAVLGRPHPEGAQR